MCEHGNESAEDRDQDVNQRENVFSFLLILLGLFSYIVHRILDYTHTTAFNFEMYSVLVLLLAMIFILSVLIVISFPFYVICLFNKDNNYVLENSYSAIAMSITLLLSTFTLYYIYIIFVQLKILPYYQLIVIILIILVSIGWYLILFNAKVEALFIIAAMVIAYVLVKIDVLLGVILLFGFLLPFYFKETLKRRNYLSESTLGILNYFNNFEIRWDSILKISIGIFLIVFVFFGMASTTPYSLIIGNLPFLHGSMNIEMESTSLTNTNPIPFTVYVTGPVSNLNISLLKVDSNFNVSRIDYLTMVADDRSSNISISQYNHMIGTTSYMGCYQISINSSVLSSGYYKIKCERIGFGNDEYVEYLFFYDAQ